MASDSSDLRSSSSSTAEDDRMVSEELEAAEVLADLAHLAMRGGDIARRTSKRVKSESPPPTEVSESLTRCSDLPRERTTSPLQHEKALPKVLAESATAERDRTETNLKVEKDVKLPNTSLVGTTGYSSFEAGKSRRNLTKAEKEERRVRRILANRESARQTIRRRQALCEELTKKAADLASENESLKRDVETAMNEYHMLENTNKQLKDQMAKVLSTEAEEIPGSHKPARVHAPPSSASPLFLYNHPPFTPLFWPPVSQSQNPDQSAHIPQNTVLMPPHVPFPELENLINSNGPSAPFYVFLYPWFFPCANHGTAIQSQPSSLQKNEPEATSTNNQGSATLTAPNLFLPIKVKTEPPGSEARITNDLNEPAEEFPQDGGDQQAGKYLNLRLSDEPSLASSSRKTAIKPKNELQSDPAPRNETSLEFSQAPSAPQERYCEPIVFSCKKSAAATAKAKARKRRKELTRLKNLHGCQCHMHC